MLRPVRVQRTTLEVAAVPETVVSTIRMVRDDGTGFFDTAVFGGEFHFSGLVTEDRQVAETAHRDAVVALMTGGPVPSWFDEYHARPDKPVVPVGSVHRVG